MTLPAFGTKQWFDSVWADAMARRRGTANAQRPVVTRWVMVGCKWEPLFALHWEKRAGRWCWGGLVDEKGQPLRLVTFDYWIDAKALEVAQP